MHFQQDDVTSLKFLNMTTLSDEQCRRRLMTSAYYSTFGNDTICAYSGRFAHSPCNGDSGGPLVFDGRVIGLTVKGVDCSSGPYGEILHLCHCWRTHTEGVVTVASSMYSTTSDRFTTHTHAFLRFRSICAFTSGLK